MFELNRQEFLNLDSYSIYDEERNCFDFQKNTILVTQNASPRLQNNENQNDKSDWGGSRILPFAFSEHGILMLANVLSSPKATAASIEIIRVFMKMRELLLSNQELLTKIAELANKVGEHDQYIKTLYDYLKSFDDEQKRRIEWQNRTPIGF
jgi:hypothetical protein